MSLLGRLRGLQGVMRRGLQGGELKGLVCIRRGVGGGRGVCSGWTGGSRDWSSGSGSWRKQVVEEAWLVVREDGGPFEGRRDGQQEGASRESEMGRDHRSVGLEEGAVEISGGWGVGTEGLWVGVIKGRVGRRGRDVTISNG